MRNWLVGGRAGHVQEEEMRRKGLLERDDDGELQSLQREDSLQSAKLKQRGAIRVIIGVGVGVVW